MEFKIKKVLVLGASGYVGSRLVTALLKQRIHVRAAARSAESLWQYPWSHGKDTIELFNVNALSRDSLARACAGCDAVYYLIHSMNPQTRNFADADRQAAQNMATLAQDSGLKRIIYLGGLGDDNAPLSRHLRSRHEVSAILHSGRIPATTLRAAMIIGAGSISFEILRSLVNRLPVMIAPRWVSTESQPIAIENVIRYLVGCLECPETAGVVYDIGGPDILSYRKLMEIYAEEAKIDKRFIIPVPFLTPRLSAYWIQMVTPYSAAIARPLAEGLRNRMVCQDDRIRETIPQMIINCREAIRQALNSA